MHADPRCIEALNKALGNELIAINQYFLHSRMLADWGFSRLADHEYRESIDEMKHADGLVQRILLLEGLPNMQALGRLRIGEDAREVLECDLALERDAMPDLRDGIALCESARDYASRDLLETILASEEEHVAWLETQLALIDQVGLENYLQSQM